MDDYRDQVIFQFLKRRRVVIGFWLYLAAAGLLCIAVGLIFLSAARADPAQNIAADWQAMMTQQAHVSDDINAMGQMIVDLDARLKWVLDTWVPKKPEAPQAKK
jgi:hypothetical protein